MDLTGLLVGTSLQIGGDVGLQKLFETDFGDSIEETAQEWADELPDDIAESRETLLRALFQEGQPREAFQSDMSRTEAREELSGKIRYQEIPEVSTWHVALVERWEEVNVRVDEEEAHPFFLLQEDDASHHLRNLAERLNSTCAEEQDLFQRTIYRLLKEQSEARELGSPWRTPAEFFGPHLQKHRLFRHTWTLVGRGELLDSLEDFALEDVSEGDPFVTVMPGRGGVGKSKIAYHLSKQLQEEHERIVRFVDREQDVEPDDLQLLPDEDVFLIADDAQQRDDMRVLLSLLERRRIDGHQDKLLILTRPSAVERLKTDLTYSGIDPSEYEELEPLESLGRDEMRALAREALGEGFSKHAEHLVRTARDSPLVVAVGGQLIQRERISPKLLERSEDFRKVVLRRFQDTLVGDIADQFDSRVVRRVLEVTAALSPVRPEDEGYLELAAEFLSTEVRTLKEVYQRLEEAGVLFRRGGLVRITPDVLSDHILHDACISNKDTSTGFAQEVYNQFSEHASERLLPNLAELDWRLGRSDGQSPTVLQGIWSDIEEQFDEADWRERRNILKKIKEAARYLPRKSLALAERAIRQTVEVEDEHRDGFVKSRVAGETVEILHRVGLSLDFLPRSLQLLWVMTDDDHLQTSQKAHSKLSDIAEYGRWKPPRVQKIILDKTEEWLEAGNAFDREPKRCLIDLVEPILEKAAESSYAEGHTFHLSPFVVDRDMPYIRELRKRAFQVIRTYGTSQDASLWSAFRVLNVYTGLLKGPSALLGMEITQNDIERFDAERVWGLYAIRELRDHWNSPLLDLKIIRSLHWPAENGVGQRLSRARHLIESIIDGIESTFELRLIRSLLSRMNFRISDSEEPAEEFEEHSIDSEMLRRETAQDFLRRYPDPDDGEGRIENLLSRLDEFGNVLGQSHPSPQTFLRFLTKEDPEYAAELVRSAIDRPDSYLASSVGAILSVLKDSKASEALQLAQEAVRTHDELARSVARSHEAWHEAAQEKDVDLWEELLQHSNERVRRAALHSLKSLAFNGEIDPVLQHAPRTRVEGDTAVADELFSLFDGGHAIDPASLSDDQIRVFLEKLEAVSELDKHWIRSFLDHASHRTPEAVFDLLIRRLEVAPDREVGYHVIGPGRMEELPSPETFEGLRKSDDYENMLREVRRYLLNEDVSASMAANLFLSLSNGLDDNGLGILTEWIESDDEERMKAVLHVLRGAAYDFVLQNPDFVDETLETVSSRDSELFDRLKRAFHSSARNGPRSGVANQPFPKDARLRDEGKQIAGDFPPWSEAHEFYSELSRRAEERIEGQLRRDEELEMQ